MTLFGNAARDHLAAGRPIYYREPDTPPGTCIKKYPDGHCELVMFDREKGEVFISQLPERAPQRKTFADALTSIPNVGEDADFARR